MDRLLTIWCFLLLLFGGLAVISYTVSDEHAATIRRAQTVLAAPPPPVYLPPAGQRVVSPACRRMAPNPATGVLEDVGPCQ